jgi:hypothetical protein
VEESSEVGVSDSDMYEMYDEEWEECSIVEELSDDA